MQMIAEPERSLKRGRSMLEVAVGGLAAQPAVASARTVLGPKRFAAADTGGLVEQGVSTRLSSTEGGDSADSPGLPRRFVRTPNFAPDGPRRPAQTQVRTAVSRTVAPVRRHPLQGRRPRGQSRRRRGGRAGPGQGRHLLQRQGHPQALRPTRPSRARSPAPPRCNEDRVPSALSSGEPALPSRRLLSGPPLVRSFEGKAV
jgi:hypothetical protein